ncbi:ATP-binding protein [Cellulosimicrobium sp. SH8]|uniref:ATP-binding protein n=1 Tax=Cellulosimicrobium sp. SH8 TaxID=2952936 RepID=UPI0021F374A0|nr:ATP-binding protein [Cellulosimicrobium sp. SH8]
MSQLVDKVEVRPGVGMLALFPSMNYKAWYAIGEFVDNSLQSWRANQGRLAEVGGGTARLNIDIEIDRSGGRITVTDNAAGIYTEDIDRAFTPAAPPADSSGLSQFGIGMKSAAAWYAKHFVVTTTALGEDVRREVTFDIPRIVEEKSDHIAVTTTSARPEEHGTTLVLTELNHPAPTGRTLGKIRDYLSSIYRHFIADTRVEIVVAGKRLSHSTPDFLVAPRWSTPDGDAETWRKDVAVYLDSGRTVSGWAGLLAKGDTAGAGFALLYRDKVVQGAGGAARDSDGYKPVKVFGRGNSFESQRLVGELDVSQIEVTHTKDSLIWHDDEEEEFLEKLGQELESEPLPLLKMARNHRTTERGRTIQTTVRDIVEQVAQAVAQPIPEVEDPPDEAAALNALPASPPIEESVVLDDTEWDVLGERLTISVIDNPADSTHWIRVRQEDGVAAWTVTVNRAHSFTQSFAYLPGMDLEPVLRLAVAIALAQIKAERSGAREPRFIIAELNRVLTGPLAKKAAL